MFTQTKYQFRFLCQKCLKYCPGQEIIKILNIFGFEIKYQKGSHVKVEKVFDGKKVVVIIPNHKEVREGTMRSIRKQASLGAPIEDLDKYFKN